MWAIVALLLLAGEAPAATPSASAVVMRQKHVEGRRHYERGEYAEALRAFQEAYAAEPRRQLLFNIAQCQRRLGRPDEALSNLRAFLAFDPPAPPDETARVERLIELVERERGTPPPTGEAAAPVSPAVPPSAPLPRLLRTYDDVELLKPTMLETAPADAPAPVYRRVWFWGVIAAVVAGAAVTAYIATRPKNGVEIEPQ